MNGDLAECVVVCGRAYHGLRGAVESQQLGDQSIVDSTDVLNGPDAVVLGRVESNHCGAEEVCGGFVAGDGDDDGGDDDVVEFEIGVGGDEAE